MKALKHYEKIMKTNRSERHRLLESGSAVLSGLCKIHEVDALEAANLFTMQSEASSRIRHAELLRALASITESIDAIV